jgi:hypothetical protein
MSLTVKCDATSLKTDKISKLKLKQLFIAKSIGYALLVCSGRFAKYASSNPFPSENQDFSI